MSEQQARQFERWREEALREKTRINPTTEWWLTRVKGLRDHLKERAEYVGIGEGYVLKTVVKELNDLIEIAEKAR